MGNKPTQTSTGADRRDAPLLPISLLSYPVLRINRSGEIIASNGVLERELGLGAQAAGSPGLVDALDAASQRTLSRLLLADVPASQHVRLVFAGHSGEPAARSFQVVREDDTAWLIGQPPAVDAERDALTRATVRAEAQTDEYARISEQLTSANRELERRAQQLEEATTAKSRFLATMSHELRTPLNAVLGYAGLLRDGVYGAVSDEQQRAVQAIMRRAKDLQGLIDDVLDLSKIEAGRMQLRVDEFEPAAVISEVKDAIGPLLRDKELRVVVRCDVRRTVWLDRTKYKQVVTHLVSNAIKFTAPHGEIEISLQSGSGDSLLTRVSDTGIGIAADDLRRIFDNFQQLDTGTTRRYAGLGLGLAIVRRLVELMGGTITVESEPGRGTTFTVAFPSRGPREAIVSAFEAVPPAATPSAEPLVLTIDDDPEVIGLLRDSLTPARYRVVGALTGDRGLELARILKPFAITLDIMMPHKDGWQVLREIKEDPATRDIPVIIMSIVSERTLGFSLGVSDYLVKPVDRQLLLDVLERLRRRSDSRPALTAHDDGDARPSPPER